jgi:biotin carboxyl carrier protein
MAAAVPSSVSRPRFRTDLVAEPIEEAGQRFVDVIDPDTGSAFRFYDVEYSLACAMDGERDLEGLVAWAREELGVAPTSDELSTVIATLGDLGYIEPGSPGASAGAPRPINDLDLGAPDALRPGVTSKRPETPRGEDDDVELGFADARNRPPSVAPPVSDSFDDVEDVELGHAPAAAQAPRAPQPTAPTQELGPAGGRPALSNKDRFADATDAAGNVVEFDALTPPPPEEQITTRPVLRPITRADADDDGPTNLPRPDVGDFDDDEVSVDLTDHMSLRPDDVKEAVRASQVMKAVEVPPELMGQLDERERALAASAEAAKNAARQRAMSESPTRPVEKVDLAEPAPGSEPGRSPAPDAGRSAPPAPDAGRSAPPAPDAGRSAPPLGAPAPTPLSTPVATASTTGSAPRELPRDAVAVSKPKMSMPIPARPSEPLIAKPVAPVEPAPSRTWPILLVLLVVAILAVAAFFVWKLYFDKPVATGPNQTPTPSAATPSAATPTPTPDPVPPPPSPEPPAPTAILTLAASGGGDSKAPSTGVVSYAIAKGTEVKVDDVIVKLYGFQKHEAKLGDGKTGGLLWDIEKRLPKELERYTEQIAAARAAGREPQAKQIEKKLADRTARLDQKKRDRDATQALLDKLVVRATTAGTVATVATVGKRVKEGDVVATLEGKKALTATFQAEGKAYSADAPVKIALKAAPDKKADCTISEVKGSAVTVSCPVDGGIADGTEVVLE